MTDGHRVASTGDWPAAPSMTRGEFERAWARDHKRDKIVALPPSPRRSGSAMSDKQIARAAVNGQMLMFRTGVLVPMEGYVVGMDDYHWFVAVPSDNHEPFQTTLIHKSCPLVTFTHHYLVDEDEVNREKVREVGQAFWEYCVTSGLTRAVSNEQEKML